MEPLVSYIVIPVKDVTTEQLKECSRVFSENYGVWKSGQRIKMSPSLLRKNCLFDDNCGLVMSLLDGISVGHAFYSKFQMKTRIGYSGIFDAEVKWITQLVTDSKYRHHKIGQSLLYHSLGTTWDIAGLVTSNPYAIRALEKATNRICDPKEISSYSQDLIENCNIPYIKTSQLYCSNESCLIDTHFEVDHTEVNTNLDNEILYCKEKWIMGTYLPDGYEYFSFVSK